MKEELLLTIGELASICNVTPKTLRHYDKLGLLKPAKINIQNGYRFYFKSHITRVITIKQLQEIGISLVEIGKFYKKNEDTNIINELSSIIEKQEKEIALQIEEFSKKLSKIKMMQIQCNNIREKFSDSNCNNFIIKQLPNRNIIYKEYTGKYSADIFRETYNLVKNHKIYLIYYSFNFLQKFSLLSSICARVVGRCLLFKINCGSYRYPSEMNKPSKYKRFRTFLKSIKFSK